MKMSKERYTEIKDGIQKIIDAHKEASLPFTVFTSRYKGLTLRRMMHDLLYVVTYDWMYDDNHPSYKAGRRRFSPHKPQPGGKTWDLYAGGLNDDHITTALMKIAKELNLTVPTTDSEI